MHVIPFVVLILWWFVTVLQIKAEKFERKKLQLLEVTKERVAALEPLLQDIYSSRLPKPNDYETRREIVRVFNDIAKDIFGNIRFCMLLLTWDDYSIFGRIFSYVVPSSFSGRSHSSCMLLVTAPWFLLNHL